MTPDLNKRFESVGSVMPLSLLSPAQLSEFQAEAERLLVDADTSGVRNVLANSPLIGDWAKAFCEGPILSEIEAANWTPVRGIIFNKSPGRNWALRWHQDKALAFRVKVDVPGFIGWSEKDGTPHAIAPVEMLEQIVTLRLHLDDADETNGALEVLPGSHANGRLSRDEVREAVENGEPRLCRLKAGEAMLMRPLLLHRSGKRSESNRDRQRRVIHIEFAPCDAPGGLVWSGR